MILGDPWVLLLLVLLPLLGWWRRRGSLPRWSFPPLFQARALPPTWRVRTRFVPQAFKYLALVLMIVAAARPLAGRQETRLRTEGIDIVMVIDVSSSMSQRDLDPQKNRLLLVKEAVGAFLAKRKNDRISLVTFARFPYTHCPFTLDTEVLQGFLKEVQLVRPKTADDGTAIGLALAHAARKLEGSKAKSRIVVLLTDGENNAGEIAPLKAADFAQEIGVRVYTIAAAGPGERISAFGLPLMPGRGIDTRELQEIAKRTGGQFYDVQDAETLRRVYDEIDRLEKVEIESFRYSDYRELYRYLLVPALVLWLLGVLLEQTIWRRGP